MTQDIEILSDIHTVLEENPEAGQREIAAKSSLSLGMTNAVLRKFAAKGWILMKKLSARHIRYIMTPTGMNELAKRSYHYMRRTFSEVRHCFDSVTQCVKKMKKQGSTQVVLYGNSDIAFILETVCAREGLKFWQVTDFEQELVVPNGAFAVIGENVGDTALELLKGKGGVSVYDVVDCGKNKI